jgi:hypothetical protein
LLGATKTEKLEEETTVLKEELKQRVNPQRVSFGLQLGVTVSNAALNAPIASGAKRGFDLGAFVEAPVIPGFLYFQPELSYVQKGADNGFFGTTGAAQLNYLEVPLLAKVKFNIPHARPFILAGVGMGYLLGAHTETGGPIMPSSRLNTIDISAVLGGGVSFPLTSSPDGALMSFSARYTNSLTSADAAAGDWRSRVFSILVGVQI